MLTDEYKRHSRVICYFAGTPIPTYCKSYLSLQVLLTTMILCHVTDIPMWAFQGFLWAPGQEVHSVRLGSPQEQGQQCSWQTEKGSSHAHHLLRQICHFVFISRCLWPFFMIISAQRCFTATLGTGAHIRQQTKQNSLHATKINPNHFSSDKTMICAGGEDKDACQVLLTSPPLSPHFYHAHHHSSSS